MLHAFGWHRLDKGQLENPRAALVLDRPVRLLRVHATEELALRTRVGAGTVSSTEAVARVAVQRALAQQLTSTMVPPITLTARDRSSTLQWQSFERAPSGSGTTTSTSSSVCVHRHPCSVPPSVLGGAKLSKSPTTVVKNSSPSWQTERSSWRPDDDAPRSPRRRRYANTEAVPIVPARTREAGKGVAPASMKPFMCGCVRESTSSVNSPLVRRSSLLR